MKICITSKNGSKDSTLDKRFGRCSYFAIADTDSGDIEFRKNENEEAGGGAGIDSGQLMAKEHIDAVITGNVGPNAMNVLNTAGITIYRGVDSTVEANLEKFKDGKLDRIEKNVASHFGMKQKGK